VGAVLVRDRPRRPLNRVAEIGSQRRPLLALLAGAAVVALGAGLIAAHVTVFALDETLIQQSAVHYTSNLPHSLLHDLDARATNRLYPLVLSIAFRLFSGTTAVRVDHVLSVLMFVSAVVPIYLMARVVLRSTWSAVAVALLAIAVPWLTLTSALFTENLSYPLFWWMVLATCRAAWRGSPLNDAIALVSVALLVGTRVQFAAVYVGYLLAVLGLSIWRASPSKGIRRRLTDGVADAARRYPLTLAIFGAVVGVYIYEHASGQWHRHVEQLFGTYSNVIIRNGLPSNMGEGLLIELIALALGVGLLPAIVSLVWFAKRMSRPQLDRRWVYLATSGVVLVVFLVLTVYAQGGYLGAMTEERYFFYVVPAFWIGALAACEDRDVRASELLACALGLAALFAAIPFLSLLTQETAFLAPIESVVPHVLTQRLIELGLTGLTIQDAVALLVLLAGVVTAVLWRRRPRSRLWWMVGCGAAVQLVLAGYAFAVIDGKVDGIQGRTSGSAAALGWVDSHARSARVVWLENLSTSAPPASQGAGDQLRATLFWNTRLKSWAELPQLGLAPVESPMSALPGTGLAVDPSSGRLASAPIAGGLSEVVEATDSPFVQLAGSSLARSPDGVLTLRQLSRPVRARWFVTGLQPDGSIAQATVVHAHVFVDRAPTAQTLTVTITLSSPPAAPPGAASPRTEIAFRLGRVERRVALAGGPVKPISLSVCLPTQRAGESGTISATRSVAVGSPNVAGVITGVAVSAAAATRHC
jgi:hypothetical protein